MKIKKQIVITYSCSVTKELGMQVASPGKILGNLGKIWVYLDKLDFDTIWVKFDSVWAKIKILHPQKHSISYDYVHAHVNPITEEGIEIYMWANGVSAWKCVKKSFIWIIITIAGATMNVMHKRNLPHLPIW